MCGLIGAANVKSDYGRRFVENGIGLLQKRGPDGVGKIEIGTVLLGHTRLRVIDVTEKSDQPMCSRSGNSVLIYNGMLYNYEFLAEKLLDKFENVAGDTRVLVEILDRFGVDVLPELDGMFAFAWYDVKARKLYLVRDRFGIKPLYYTFKNQELLFSSTLGPLLSISNSLTPNSEVVADYLNHNFLDHSKQTFFSGIFRLAPGEFGCFDLTTKKLNFNTWHYQKIERLNRNKNLVEGLENELIDVLSSHLKSHVPVGLNLSGGLDSSVLASMYSRLIEDKNSTTFFTMDFPNSVYGEGAKAKKISEYLGVKIELIQVSEDKVIEAIHKTILAQEEPFGGVMTIGWSLLFDKAKSLGFKVLIDGSGLDDLLAGYDSYLLHYLGKLKASQAVEYREFLELVSINLNLSLLELEKRIEYLSFVQSRSYLDGTFSLGRSFMRETWISSLEESASQVHDINKLMLDGLTKFKVPRALRFKDKASMEYGIELRVPFLSKSFVNFAHSIPESQLFKNGRTKSLFRELSNIYLPPNLTSDTKHNIQSPQSEWLLHGELSELLVRALGEKDSFLSNFIDTEKSLNHIKDVRNRNNHKNLNHLWQWLNLSLWYSEFF